MVKNTIIITLIILLIYAYYQQNNQSNIAIDKVDYDNLIKDLKRQVQHYQKLYEDRVAKDLGLERKSVEIQTDNIGTDDKETQTNLSDKQISLLTQQWNQVASWATKLGIDTNQKWNLGMLKNKISQELESAKKKPPTSEKSTSTSLTLNSRATQTDDDKDLENNNKTLSEKTKAQEQEIKKIVENFGEKRREYENKAQIHQTQLRKIGLLFGYKDERMILFEDLYSALQQIAERERERETKIVECPEDDGEGSNDEMRSFFEKLLIPRKEPEKIKKTLEEELLELKEQRKNLLECLGLLDEELAELEKKLEKK